MPGIEIRQAAVIPDVVAILNLQTLVVPRIVVNRFGESVRGAKLQPFREPLGCRNPKGIVVGISTTVLEENGGAQRFAREDGAAGRKRRVWFHSVNRLVDVADDIEMGTLTPEVTNHHAQVPSQLLLDVEVAGLYIGVLV